MIGGWGISCKIALIWISLNLIHDKSALVQVMALCHQATSYYLSQVWTSSMASQVTTCFERPPCCVVIPHYNCSLQVKLWTGGHWACVCMSSWRASLPLMMRTPIWSSKISWTGVSIFVKKKIDIKNKELFLHIYRHIPRSHLMSQILHFISNFDFWQLCCAHYWFD